MSRKALTLPKRAAARVVLFATLLVVPGCFALASTRQSPVSQGELYEVGVPEYDAAFVRVHNLQLTAGRAPTELRKLYMALASALGLAQNASPELVAEHLEKRAAELAKGGSKLRIELIGLAPEEKETDAVVTLTDAAGRTERTPLVTALEQMSKGAVKLSVQLRDTKASAKKLTTELPALDAEVDERFKKLGPIRAKETHRNLNDAIMALPTLTRAIETSETNCAELIALLQKVAPAEKKDGKAEADKPASTPPSKPASKPPTKDQYQP